MVRTTGNQKLVVVLSITILAGVLVTGTIVNIVSAANSINIQTKANQHPITSTIAHVVSARHDINIQTKAKHPITRTGSPQIVSVAHGTKCKSGSCPNGTWPSKFTDLKYFPNTGKDEIDVTGVLKGQTYNGQDYGIWEAPVTFSLAFRDNHAFPKQPGETFTDRQGDGKFKAMIWACDDQKYATNDHTAYFTAYYPGGYNLNKDTSPGSSGGYTRYDYDGTTSLHDLGGNSRLVKLNICDHADTRFTDMRIMSNPHDNFTYSGKLMDDRGLSQYGGYPVGGAMVDLTVKYLDSKMPAHGHDFPCLPKNKPSCSTNSQGFSTLQRQTTSRNGGTFSGSFAACDRFVRPGMGYSSVAQLTAEFHGGNTPSGWDTKAYYLPATSVWDTFTTMPCSGVYPTHDSKK
jgi:hypothetical protein